MKLVIKEKCTECEQRVPLNQIWVHFQRWHEGNLTDKEYLRDMSGIDYVPECNICGKQLEVNRAEFTYVPHNCEEFEVNGIRFQRICPVCGIGIPYSKKPSLPLKHFHKCHSNNIQSDFQFLMNFHRLVDPPRCLNCGGYAAIDPKKCTFKKFCSGKCSRSYTEKQKWTPERRAQARAYYRELDKTSPVYGFKHIQRWREEYPDKFYEIARANGINNTINSGKLKTSRIQSDVYTWIKNLFPNETIQINPLIDGLVPDILLVERNLIIEIDGKHWHGDKIEKDFNRDKKLYELGFRVRRIDAVLARDEMSDSDWISLIEIESKIEVPYWQRLPKSEWDNWKLNIHKTGYPLLYEVKNAK